MRLWSVHPMYLDSAAMVACWREGLLARKVLLGETRGYRNHPQLIRFRATANPVAAIDTYLNAVCDEAVMRGYSFDRTKIGEADTNLQLLVTDKQLAYEFQHLLNKLKKRQPALYAKLANIKYITPHPLFNIIKGDIEVWEIV